MPNNRQFTDIDLSFFPHPNTGDLLVKNDESAIKNAVKNLILTRHYERPFHSELGTSVNTLMFELPSPGLVAMIQEEIKNTIENFEPRVVLMTIDTKFSPDNLLILVSIVFRIVNTQRPINVQFTLNRTR